MSLSRGRKNNNDDAVLPDLTSNGRGKQGHNPRAISQFATTVRCADNKNERKEAEVRKQDILPDDALVNEHQGRQEESRQERHHRGRYAWRGGHEEKERPKKEAGREE